MVLIRNTGEKIIEEYVLKTTSSAHSLSGSQGHIQSASCWVSNALAPGRGCSDQPELCGQEAERVGVSVGQETRAPKPKGVCQGQRVG